MANKFVVSFAAALTKGLLSLVAPLIAYYQGKKNKEADIVKKESKVIKKQRDNNLANLTAARKRMRLRRDKGK